MADSSKFSVPITRRSVLAGLAAAVAYPVLAADQGLVIIEAPSNLGLRPPRAGHEPGTWRAPTALNSAGLRQAISATRAESMSRPNYRFDAQATSRIRNAPEIRRFSEQLAALVAKALNQSEFPVVVGGDCSLLLGCAAGARTKGPIGLIHVDGHSDFYHPGNYNVRSRLGSAAGMDLALVTGRGEPLLAQWDGAALVADAFVTQLGERDESEPDYDYRDIEQTAIRRIFARDIQAHGIRAAVERALAPVGNERRPVWLHIDLDVLDQTALPAVDSPGTPGLTFDQLAQLIAQLRASGRILGLDFTNYDPELDPDGRYARGIVDCFKRALSGNVAQGIAMLPAGLHAFDFEFGEWRVHHRVKRATAVTAGPAAPEWLEFDGTCSDRPLMGGRANVEEHVFNKPDGVTYGVALRALDSKTGQWATWWVDGRDPHGALDPPVKGRFEGGIGTFYSDGTVGGKPIRTRFIWSHITSTSARWEQAYSSDAGKTWDTNWIMEFQRIS